MNISDINQEHVEYFNYLQQRSRLGAFYRKYILYPRLCRYLSGRVVDIGCGIGDFLKFRANTMGIDINPLTIDYCKKQDLNAALIQGTSWPFDNHSFDGAVLDNVLEHIEHPDPLLLETFRILKKGGALIIGVPGRKGYQIDPDHKIYYDNERLKDVAGKAGFVPIKSFRTPLNFPFLEDLINQHCLYVVFSSH